MAAVFPVFSVLPRGTQLVALLPGMQHCDSRWGWAGLSALQLGCRSGGTGRQLYVSSSSSAGIVTTDLASCLSLWAQTVCSSLKWGLVGGLLCNGQMKTHALLELSGTTVVIF